MVSRLLGFVKAILVVTAIGGTSAAVGGQTFEIANSASTYLFNLIAGGVLGAILVPQLVRSLREGPAGQETLDRMVTLALVVGAVLATLLTLAAPAVVWAYAAGWSDEWAGLATAMAYWCLPQVFFYIVFAVLSQILNSREIFGVPAWAPSVSNLIGIIGLVAFLLFLQSGLGPVGTWTPMMIGVLCGSATLGVAAQAAVLWWAVQRAGIRFTMRWGVQGLGGVSRIAGWTFLGVAAGQVAFLATSNVASTAGEALNTSGVDGPSLNSLSAAYLLLFLPHGVIAVSLATALYTRMSHFAADADHGGLEASVAQATGPVAYLMFATTAVFVALGPRITDFLWHTTIIGTVLQVLAVGSIGFSQAFVLNRASFALRDALGPFWTQLTVALVSAAGAVASGIFLTPEWVIFGIAFSVSVANFAGWAVARSSLRRRLRILDHAPDRTGRTVLFNMRLLLAAAVSASLGVWGAAVGAHYETFWGQLFTVGILAIAIGVVYISVAWVLGDRTLNLVANRGS